ncbi:CoA transferase subunit A [Nakamurella lactea]|uniref:CoA transferase subunit A n=1 Tax=Nakamurella lactea TaxID=459515 RepID=UPI0003F9608C|nr:CoA-transferase [Nakamurella lactea]
MKEKLTSLEDALRLVRDDDVVGLQAGPTQCAPMELVRGLIRDGRQNLHVVTLSGGLALDWLAAAGCLSRCTFAAVTMEHYGLAQCFRQGVESGRISAEELSETALFARLGAAARGLPFLPTRGMIGTDLLQVGNPNLAVIADPFGGMPVVACRALPLDVALLHAARADRFGNVGIDAGPRYPTIGVMPRAAARVIVTVEEIVSTDVLRENPDRTILPGFAVDAVVLAPHGAHPTSMFPAYDYDADLFEQWVACSSDAAATREFLNSYVRVDPAGYRAAIGPDRLARLERAMTR